MANETDETLSHIDFRTWSKQKIAKQDAQQMVSGVDYFATNQV